MVSRPARALWIEIKANIPIVAGDDCRGPRGPCGLKSRDYKARYLYKESRPARALWIEIAFFTWMRKEKLVEAREGLVD